MTNAFKTLACLNKLTRLDLSANAISSHLLDSDFDDTLRNNLQWLSLSNNVIPSLDSNVFMYPNGTTKFPNLDYLDLSNNLIVALDILWPMTIPNPNLYVDLSNNPIKSLHNQLNGLFTDNSYIAMSGNRTIDVTGNNLVSFDDSQLLQYNIGSSNGFKIFLNKLQNYDFKQQKNKFVCNCPLSTGLYTVNWYKMISNTLSNIANSSILQLNCSKIVGKTVFNFKCTVSRLINFQILFIKDKFK